MILEFDYFWIEIEKKNGLFLCFFLQLIIATILRIMQSDWPTTTAAANHTDSGVAVQLWSFMHLNISFHMMGIK